MTDWKTTFPGSGAVAHVHETAQRWLNGLEAGDANEVKRSLREKHWRISFDWNGVPSETLEQMDLHVNSVFAMLKADPPDVVGARNMIGILLKEF